MKQDGISHDSAASTPAQPSNTPSIMMSGEVSSPAPGERINARVSDLGSKLLADFHDYERQAIERCAGLLESEVNGRISSLEETLSLQLRSLKSLHDLSIETGSKMNRVIGAVERFCAIQLAQRQPAPEAPAQAASLTNGNAPIEVESAAPSSESEAGVRCPECGSSDTRPAVRLSPVGRALRACFIASWRCRSCSNRFYRILWSIGPHNSAKTL